MTALNGQRFERIVSNRLRTEVTGAATGVLLDGYVTSCVTAMSNLPIDFSGPPTIATSWVLQRGSRQVIAGP